ncbi:hypothetical protein MTO96_017077 [Rhipicephalus appendiculatus]
MNHWSEYLRETTFQVNNQPHVGLHTSPFQLLYNHVPRRTIENELSAPTEPQDQAKVRREEAQNTLTDYLHELKRKYDAKHSLPPFSGSEEARASALRAPVKDGIVYSPYPALELRDDETFYQYIKRRFLERAALPALERNGEWLTFADLLHLMERYASGFQSHGVVCGSRVCVNVTNSAEAIAAVYALCFTGAAVVLTRPGLTEREVLYQVKDSGATFMLTEKQNAHKVLSIHKSCPFKCVSALVVAALSHPVCR